jgi:hypothetical protein
MIRQKAVEALHDFGGETVITDLVQALKDSDVQVRLQAVKAVSKIGGNEALAGLIDALNDSDYEVKEEAALVLASVGERIEPELLVPSLASPNYVTRSRAAVSLGNLGNKKAIQYLILVLRDPDETIRISALKALQNLGWEPDLTEEKQLYERIEDEMAFPSGVRRLISESSKIKDLANTPWNEATREILETLAWTKHPKALSELNRVMKSRTVYAKTARDLLNTGVTEEDHCLCPQCLTYLGIRGELKRAGTRITNEMKESARQRRVAILSDAYYVCPTCGDQVLL